MNKDVLPTVSIAHSSTLSAGAIAGHVADLVEQGKLKPDPAQASAISELDRILDELTAPQLANKQSALGWLFGKKPSASHCARGLYLWGGVGRGKTMLMDMFFDVAPTQPKRRAHFHGFMQDVHSRIHTWRQAQKTAKDKSADPIPPLAEALASEARLLCFDEFAVTDVADAMILARLFTGLFERGVTVVATSNVQPDLLYKDGLNRSFFLPFIELVKAQMSVLELDSPTDHRMRALIKNDVYFVSNEAGFDRLWHRMVGEGVEETATLEIKGRSLVFERSQGGQVRSTFDELCRRALGAGDYLAIAERFHTVFVAGVPVMAHADRNAVKRFIALVDTLYDAGRVIVVSAEALPDALYRVDHGTEAFEFQRTISRLTEMQSRDWFARVSELSG